jgi:prepilin-type N-terminal cleavage/methylation domain-containing protein
MDASQSSLPRPRRRSASERGFTLIEVLIAMALVSVGVAATIGVFGSSNRATLRAQQSEVGVQQAQAEIDRLSTISYGALALTSTPAASSTSTDPRYRISGSNFEVKSGLTEALVTTPASGETAAVAPGPDVFTVGSGGAAITGKIHRFITWRDEQCPQALCDGTQNTKRVTVAVTVDPTGNQPQRPPVWLSTIIADPDAVPPGREAPPDDAADPTSAQSFYLYDTRCGQSSRQAPSADHATHNTASSAPSPVDNSVCENTDTSKQPDLMGRTPPTGTTSTPLYKYSSDLAGSYPGALAMLRRGSTCRTSYSAADTSSATAISKWNVHAWATPAFTSTFHLSGRVSLSFFTTTVGGVSGRGVVCATLLDRQVFSGLPSDRVLGSTTYDLSAWPSDIRRLTFTFSLPQQEDVAAGHRLVLALHVRGESDQDLVLLYDHVSYSSLLEVETTTPITG